MIAQGLNTSGTLIGICQNDKYQFSFLYNTYYLGLSQAVPSAISTLGFWYIQRYWRISTKKMVSLLDGEREICILHRHEHCHRAHSAMGNDRHLDQ